MTAAQTAARTAATAEAGSGRAPWTVHLAAVPTALFAAVTCVGAVYFGTHDDVTRPAGAPAAGSWQAWCLILVLLTYAVTALASVPGVYRRSRLAWGLLMAYYAAMVLFGSLKYFGLGEGGALVFLVVDLVSAAALLAPQSRRYVGLA